MTADDVKAFFEDLSRGDVIALEPRLAEDVVLEFPGSRFGGKQEGRRRVVVFLKQNQRLFQGGLLFDVHWAGIADDRAVAQWTNAGITKDGTPYANRGVTVFTVRQGAEGERIVRIEDYLDTERLAATWPK
jgi:ketosteroid isomerase-like protein